MACSKVLALLVSIAVTLVNAHYNEHKHVEVEEHAHPKYEFKYGVKDIHTHDIKEQHEKRDGDKVEGYYRFVEADGTTRTVHYTADKHNGFQAHVEKSGHAAHAEPIKTYSYGPFQGYYFENASGFGEDSF